ncbi:hypothetical protein ACIQRC_35205 [Streptomyces californicus]|uniref:hypothetical protein n=1 Tax=Streptomyces californicus TaxID=67351 RepID=UPI00381C5C20
MACFAREAAVAGGLFYPGIVTFHDFGSAVHDGRRHAYLVMQLQPGKALSTVLEAGRASLPCPRPSAWPPASPTLWAPRIKPV